MHPVISQAAQDPSQLPILASFVKEFRDFINSDKHQMTVQSTISYHRLLYHQIASFLGLNSHPEEKGSPRILILKPAQFDRGAHQVQMRLQELGRVLETAGLALQRNGATAVNANVNPSASQGAAFGAAWLQGYAQAQAAHVAQAQAQAYTSLMSTASLPLTSRMALEPGALMPSLSGPTTLGPAGYGSSPLLPSQRPALHVSAPEAAYGMANGGPWMYGMAPPLMPSFQLPPQPQGYDTAAANNATLFQYLQGLAQQQQGFYTSD